MSTKLPDDAFEKYVSMGPGRSYQELAKKLGVDKRTIVRRAAEGKWTERLAKIQRKADEATDEKLAADMQAVRERQLKEARYVQAFSLKAMQTLPPEKAFKAAQALAVGWKHELLLLGDPTERQEQLDIAAHLEHLWREWGTEEPEQDPESEE